MDYKVGVLTSCLGGVAEVDAVEKIKNAGFEMIFAESNDVKTVATIKDRAEKFGLSLDFLHAPFRGINDFWLPGDAYLGLRDGIYSSIDAASAANVPAIVCHVSSGWFPPQLCDIGFSRFDALVDYAISKNVKVAFENLRKVGNLGAIMERYERIDSVGFCYDCGHEHCYTETMHFLDIYGSRLICTHIHDNHGRSKEDYWGDPDEHLLPFEGNIDYADMMRRIRATDYKGAITLEIFKSNGHADMTDEEFLATAFDRVKKIVSM